MRAHAGEQRKGAIVDFHHHASQGVLGFLIGDLEQLQDHWLILAQHVAIGDPEQQAVSDLAGGAGDGNANGTIHGLTPGVS